MAPISRKTTAGMSTILFPDLSLRERSCWNIVFFPHVSMCVLVKASHAVLTETLYLLVTLNM